MGNYSLTQGGNVAVIIGLVMLILKYYHVNIAQEEIQNLLGFILGASGVIISWYGRWRKGDLTLGGFRK